jgi:cobalt-zinc-cadmium efflux system membrane fusion protein
MMFIKHLYSFMGMASLFLLSSCLHADLPKQETLHPADTAVKTNIPCDGNTEPVVDCPGYIIAKSPQIIPVSAMVSGIVKSTGLSTGSPVKKGSVLAILESLELLKMQQEYLEFANQLVYAREEYKRQGELAIENASSVKKLQLAQSEFLDREIKCKSLRAQLELLGINADSLDVDHLVSDIRILAPLSATIYESNVLHGQYMTRGEPVVKMILSFPPVLNLTLDEKYFPRIRKGQVVYFTMTSDSIVYKARLSAIHSIDSVSHTFRTTATIDPIIVFHDGITVRGRIVTGNCILQP